MGVSGGKDGSNAAELAAITAGAVLAGELSLLASLAEGSLARSHVRLARGKDGSKEPYTKEEFGRDS
jgi:hydroxymethylglutaryl-CoA reductase (NADPH)